MTSAKRIGQTLLAVLIAAAVGVLSGCSSGVEGLGNREGSLAGEPGQQCVKPKQEIRRNHMELIKHQRDETVHKGIRASDHRLASCIECHVRRDDQGQPVPVNAPGQFCAGCHQYAGESLNCFQCHSSVPRAPQTAASDLAFHPEQASGRTLAAVAGELGVLHQVRQEKGN